MYRFVRVGACADLVQGHMTQTRLKELREAKGLTQERLAELLGVSHAAVQRWEVGKRAPRGKNLERLAGVFHIGIGELFDPPPNILGHSYTLTERDVRPPDDEAKPSLELINSGLQTLPYKPQKFPMNIGGDPVKNGELILRAVKNLENGLNDLSDKFSGDLKQLSQNVGKLGRAIEQAQQIETLAELGHKPRKKRR
jgi:transcriptional regulator with XRE-family HTH domain